MEEKIDYESIPVYYCTHCMSLNIKGTGEYGLTYCDNCGSTDYSETSIDDWKEMYKKRYGKYLTDYKK